MKKRFVAVVAFGIFISPAIFAQNMGAPTIGSFDRAKEATDAGASRCSASMRAKSLSADSDDTKKDKGADSAGVAS
jgi:hypothetical protein